MWFLIFCTSMLLMSVTNFFLTFLVFVVLVHKHKTKGQVKIMFKVKNDHPPIPYEVQVGKVTDSEGEEITNPDVLAALQVQVSSTDTGVLKVNELDGPKKGEIVIGRSGQASVNAQVLDGQGNVLAAGSISGIVTTGDPSKIDSLNFTLDGVVDEPPASDEGSSTGGLGGASVGSPTNESGGGIPGSTASEGGSNVTEGGFQTEGGMTTESAGGGS